MCVTQAGAFCPAGSGAYTWNQCDTAHCTSNGNDCNAPGEEPKTCEEGYFVQIEHVCRDNEGVDGSGEPHGAGSAMDGNDCTADRDCGPHAHCEQDGDTWYVRHRGRH